VSLSYLARAAAREAAPSCEARPPLPAKRGPSRRTPVRARRRPLRPPAPREAEGTASPVATRPVPA